MATAVCLPPQQSAANNGSGNTAKISSSLSAPLPLFDAILDLPHPGASSNAATPPRRYIPPPTQSLNDGDKAIIKELLSDTYLQRISGFCFPNYNPTTEKDNSNSDSGNGNNVLTKYDIYTSQFTSKSFILELQMQGGVRVIGYVRIYLPSHPDAKGRTDVGRRPTRALVLLVRRSSSEHSNSAHENNHCMLYESMISTLESLLYWQTSISSKEDAFESTTVQWRALCGQLTQASLTPPSNGMLSLSGLEFSFPPFNLFDKHSFGYFGASHFTTDMAILPLLRRVGASVVLRLLAAILCERRIILTSTSPQRLTHAIAQAIPALLRCGMLHWHHVRVPLMPPAMMGYLAAPCPYICGVLSQYMVIIKGIDHLGQVLLVDLDSCELHVYGTTHTQAHVAFPDLLRPIAAVDQRYSQQTSMNSTGASSHGSVEGMARAQTAMAGAPSPIYESIQQQHATLTEALASELTEVLRYDKTNWAMTVGASGRAADAVVESFSNVTAKAGKGLKRFLAKKANNALGNSGGSTNNAGIARGSNIGGTSSRNMSPQQQLQTSPSGDVIGVDSFLDEDEENSEEQRRVQEVLDRFWQEEFAYNLRAEEDARIAMTAFFCCLLGEYSTYVSPNANNPRGLIFDRTKFLEQRRLRGDYDGTPMHALLHQLVQTQMLTHFVQQQIDSITAQMQAAGANTNAIKKKSVMETTIDQLRQSKLDYSLPTVRRVVRQISNGRQAKTLQNVQLARERALALTSKNGYEMNRNAKADLIQLTEACRIMPMVRAATLSVLWYRIADSKGMQSKHALLSLIVLKNLLLNGPLVCIAEISQYVHVIRVLRVYQSLISAVNAKDIRIKASEVYELLVDGSKLFIQRRAQAMLRREAFLAQEDTSNKGPPPKMLASKKILRREAHLAGRTGIEWKRMKFAQVHALVKPAGSAAVVIASDLLDFGGPAAFALVPVQSISTPAQASNNINSNNYQAELNDIFSCTGHSSTVSTTPSCSGDGDVESSLARPAYAANRTTQHNESVFDMQGMHTAAVTTSDSNARQAIPGAHSSASNLKSIRNSGTGNVSSSHPGQLSNISLAASNWRATSSLFPIAPSTGGVFHSGPNASAQSSANQQTPLIAPMQASVPSKAPNSVPVFGLNQPHPHMQQHAQLSGRQQPPPQWHEQTQDQQQQPLSVSWQQQRRPSQGPMQPQQQLSSHQQYTEHGQIPHQQGQQPQRQHQQHYHGQNMQPSHPPNQQTRQTQCAPNQIKHGQISLQYESNAGIAQPQNQGHPGNPKQVIQFDPFM